MAALARAIAFDPGLKGAMACVDEAGNIIGIIDLPVVAGEVNPQLLRGFIAAYGPLECAIIEKQQAYPKQGVSSSFKTGCGYGILIGITAGMQIPTYYWTAAQWKKLLKLNSDKEYSRQRALQRWPADTELFKLKKHEGRAEAALLGATWFMSKERKELLGTSAPTASKRRLIRRYPDGHVATVAGLEH
jgi:crossover junction endodeoxyribonuclease RuvC